MEPIPLKDLVTVVIPSKNEGWGLVKTLQTLSLQKDSLGLRVIIADCSDEPESLSLVAKLPQIIPDLQLECIPGGYPAQGRAAGAALVKTPYLLFLDADILLLDRQVIRDCLHKTRQLTSVNFTTESGYNWIYQIFTFTQRLMRLCGSSFAIGGFQLFRTEIYHYTGGYDPSHRFAEDYWVSNRIHPYFFTLHHTTGVWTSARRFRRKGLGYMLWVMVRCWWHRGNPKFYQESHGYWD